MILIPFHVSASSLWVFVVLWTISEWDPQHWPAAFHQGEFEIVQIKNVSDGLATGALQVKGSEAECIIAGGQTFFLCILQFIAMPLLWSQAANTSEMQMEKNGSWVLNDYKAELCPLMVQNMQIFFFMILLGGF